tara:strand:- start:2377 stop:2856 length:480 start_codon:yes stop_codon:yes gene_type:complete
MKPNKKTISSTILSFLIAFTISFFLSSCDSDPSKKIKEENVKSTKERLDNATDFPEIKFEKLSHDFGEIQEGVLAETVFTFTNVGNSDLIISNASGSCGCTVPDYPKDTPIKPGEGGSINVKFDSSNRPGLQRKAVTLITNTAKGKQILNIKSIVIPKS